MSNMLLFEVLGDLNLEDNIVQSYPVVPLQPSMITLKLNLGKIINRSVRSLDTTDPIIVRSAAELERTEAYYIPASIQELESFDFCEMFANKGIPWQVQERLIQDVVSKARRLLSLSFDGACILIVVSIGRVHMVELDVDNNPTGATKSSIDALERVVLDIDLNRDMERCAFCMEEIEPLNVKAICMPCSHVYHEHCIVPWLQINRTCPLCRQQIPVHDP